jgi:hypothetical protein
MNPSIGRIVPVLLLLLLACASGGASGSRSSDVVTHEEIAGVQVSNLYEVVERLRPRWLTLRGARSFGLGTGVVVYQEQTYLGEADVLRQLGRETAESLQYMDGPTASASLPGLGSRHVQGAIIIRTRR